MARKETIFELAGLVFPPKEATIIKARSFGNSVRVGDCSKPVSRFRFFDRLESLPDVQVIAASDPNAYRTTVLPELQQDTRWDKKFRQWSLRNSSVKQSVQVILECQEDIVR